MKTSSIEPMADLKETEVLEKVAEMIRSRIDPLEILAQARAAMEIVGKRFETFDSMKRTIEALEAAGLRKNLKIMIGGGQIDEQLRQYVNADAYGRDAIAAVNLCNRWIGG
jgi:methanogenic corrinoid protein MtbC1